MAAEHDNPEITLTVSITTENGETITSTKILSKNAVALADRLPYIILEQEADKVAQAYRTLRHNTPATDSIDSLSAQRRILHQKNREILERLCKNQE